MVNFSIRLAVEQFSMGNVAYYEQITEAMSPRDRELTENYLHLRFSGPYRRETNHQATPIREA